MQFQASRLFSTLPLLLYVGFCSANPKGPVNPVLGDKGIMVQSATCDGSYYPTLDINNTVRGGIARIETLLQSQHLSDEYARYEPAKGETLPYEGPYYLQRLTQFNIHHEKLNHHYVVITEKGLIVNVIYQVGFSKRRRIFEDCHLEYV